MEFEWDRRAFLRTVGATGVMAAAAGVVPGTVRATPAVREERARVAIIGAGLGGAITAFRLADAGVATVVLERGRRWPITAAGDTFPVLLRPDQRSVWMVAQQQKSGSSSKDDVLNMLGDMLSGVREPLPPYTGLVDYIVGDTTDVVTGAGVGGSTLVFAGMFPQPNQAVFSRVFPGFLDYDELDRIYFPRARQRLGGGPIPDDILANPAYASGRLYRSYVERAGVRAERLDVNFDWDIIRKELNGKLRPAASIGNYVTTSCNSGAKLSVDRTYLARAEATGHCTVKPLHRVTDITQDPKGRYVITSDRLNEQGAVVERVVIVADALVLAAGAARTPAMLTKARATGRLPHLGEQVGAGWGTNCDRFLLMSLLPDATGAPQGGPPTFMARDDASDSDSPANLVMGPIPFPVETHAMACLGMGLPDKFGRFEYDAQSGRAELNWAADSNESAAEAVNALAARVVAGTGSPLANSFDTGALRQTTVHPLGGAVLGQATDEYGRLHGYKNLYCMDGSLMPGSTAAVNPALTIAAIIERCLDHVIPADFA